MISNNVTLILHKTIRSSNESRFRRATQPFKSILVVLLNEVTLIPREFVLVQDDYHTTQSDFIHAGLTHFLENL